MTPALSINPVTRGKRICRALRIALISDTHLATRAVEFAGNFAAVAQWIDASGFDLALHLGDITADAASNAAEFTEARQALSVCRTPMRFLPGNHDIGDNPAGPGAKSDEHPLDLGRLNEYRSIFGPDRWCFEAQGWRLVGLNAQLFGTGTSAEEEQFAWVEDVLTNGKPVALFLHKPLFRNSPADDEVHIRYVPVAPRGRLLDLFEDRDLRLVVSGHAHQQRRILLDRVEHVWLPSTAFTIPDALQEAVGRKLVGAASLELSEQSAKIEFVRPDGLRDLRPSDHPHVYPQIDVLRRTLDEKQ